MSCWELFWLLGTYVGKSYQLGTEVEIYGCPIYFTNLLKFRELSPAKTTMRPDSQNFLVNGDRLTYIITEDLKIFLKISLNKSLRFKTHIFQIFFFLFFVMRFTLTNSIRNVIYSGRKKKSGYSNSIKEGKELEY